MALARLALKNLQQRASSSSLWAQISSPAQKQRSWGSQLLRGLSSAAEEKPGAAAHEVAVAEGGKKSKLFPRRRSRRGLWRRNNRDFAPALWEFFPYGLGNALVQATENMNKPIENLSPWHLGVVRKNTTTATNSGMKCRGQAKEDVKITVEDGVPSIRGEHKEEEEEGSDDSIDGVLNIVIPKSEKAKKDVKEVQVQ
ncbi:hypothetical protein DH2020_038256 [Rehmannia glutinosa]|uniref:Uncharacterized protein n=1 Tax=Rehmannia glutinosa TaxID=99300 RepID=A0ABR0V1C6_REHGL